MSARPTHYAAGASLGLAVGQVGVWTSGWSTADVLLLAAMATWSAPGMDVDQRAFWRSLDRRVPDEWLGGGGPLSHRGVTHSALGPPAMLVGWLALLAHVPALAGAWWLGVGVSTGWASHWIMDYLYGHAVRTPEGAVVVRRGVPTLLWYGRVGGIWTSGGPGSAFAGFVLSCLCVGQVVALLGGWHRTVTAVADNPGALGGFGVLIAASWVLGERKPRRRRQVERVDAW